MNTGTLAGFFALALWSFSALLTAHLGRLPPLEATALTWVVTCVLFGGYSFSRREPLLQHFKRPVSDYLLLLSGIGLGTIAYFIAFKNAPAFEANTLNYLWPILLMLFISIFQKAPVTVYTIAGMTLGFAGTILLSLPHSGGGMFMSSLGLGHLMAIVAAVVWAFYSCFARNKNYPLPFLLPIFLISGAATFVAHFIFEPFVMPNATEIITIFLMGFIRLGYVFWDYAMRHGNQAVVTSVSYFVPLTSTLILIAGGYGTASPAVAFAAGLIIAGCLVVNGDRIKHFTLKPFRRS